MINIFLSLGLLIVSLFGLVKSAQFATKYASRLARKFHMSEFVLSFFIVAVISTFPEAAVSIISAFKGVPQFGLATLLGSNVADLTLVFGIVALFSPNGIAVKSQLLRKDFLYLFILIFPVLLGIDGHLSRADGVLLILSGLFFFFTLYMDMKKFRKEATRHPDHSLVKSLLFLICSLVALFISAHYTVEFSAAFAKGIGLPDIIVGLIVVSIGTCLPELLFSIKSVETNHDSLALGDILGTVIIDATIIIGITALIRPFDFSPSLVYITGSAMFLAGMLTIHFIRSDKILTKKEGLILLLFYLIFLLFEFLVRRLISPFN
ncbi:MAG: sodium:calcium antiporter [Nanoarchaeota archaeon]|nr:sodium:calcium antiporter [Nanoarchaeota archaeon]